MFEKRDLYSGIPWVYVDGDQVRAHPKGRLDPVLWAIALWFILTNLAMIGVLIAGGNLSVLALLFILVGLGTGIALILRAPVAIVLAVVQMGLLAFFFVTNIQSHDWLSMLMGIGNILALFYLIDGDRPNFIYRHRYRKYSTQTEDPDV